MTYTKEGFWFTFFVCFLVFDFCYYFAHRALHTKRLFRFHAHHHHLARVTTVLSGLSMSFAEVIVFLVFLVFIPGILSLFMQLSFYGWVSYVLFNTLYTVLGHINAEITPKVYAQKPFHWLVHPVIYHSIHHARMHRNYCFILSGLDRIFGTEWEDWKAVHQRNRPVAELASLTNFCQQDTIWGPGFASKNWSPAMP
jgi:lathosterol oxidase